MEPEKKTNQTSTTAATSPELRFQIHALNLDDSMLLQRPIYPAPNDILLSQSTFTDDTEKNHQTTSDDQKPSSSSELKVVGLFMKDAAVGVEGYDGEESPEKMVIVSSSGSDITTDQNVINGSMEGLDSKPKKGHVGFPRKKTTTRRRMPRFDIALKEEEIERDILAIANATKMTRNLSNKKRSMTMQRNTDMVFPGLGLSSMKDTAVGVEGYDGEESPEKIVIVSSPGSDTTTDQNVINGSLEGLDSKPQKGHVGFPRKKTTTRRMPRFDIALKEEEIKRDILGITNATKMTRNLPNKKRSMTMQRNMDMVFPGLGLSSITVDSYKVKQRRKH